MELSIPIGEMTQHEFVVTHNRIVRHLLPEAQEFQSFPEVFATGFMVGVMEWACVKALGPHLAPELGSVGVHVDISHAAPTPIGFTVTIETKVLAVEGGRVSFEVSAHDGVHLIGRGQHDRAIINTEDFSARVEKKRAQALGAA